MGLIKPQSIDLPPSTLSLPQIGVPLTPEEFHLEPLPSESSGLSHREIVKGAWVVGGTFFVATQYSDVSGLYGLETPEQFFLICADQGVSGKSQRYECRAASFSGDGFSCLARRDASQELYTLITFPNVTVYTDVKSWLVTEDLAIAALCHQVNEAGTVWVELIDLKNGTRVGDMTGLPWLSMQNPESFQITFTAIPGACDSPGIALMELCVDETSSRYFIYPLGVPSSLEVNAVPTDDPVNQIYLRGNLLKTVLLNDGYWIVYDDDNGAGIYSISSGCTTLSLDLDPEKEGEFFICEDRPVQLSDDKTRGWLLVDLVVPGGERRKGAIDLRALHSNGTGLRSNPFKDRLSYSIDLGNCLILFN